jgi:hypothetical protein
MMRYKYDKKNRHKIDKSRYTNSNKFLFETPQPSLLPLEK